MCDVWRVTHSYMKLHIVLSTQQHLPLVVIYSHNSISHACTQSIYHVHLLESDTILPSVSWVHVVHMNMCCVHVVPCAHSWCHVHCALCCTQSTLEGSKINHPSQDLLVWFAAQQERRQLHAVRKREGSRRYPNPNIQTWSRSQLKPPLLFAFLIFSR